jgi:TfoX C-terminal domain
MDSQEQEMKSSTPARLSDLVNIGYLTAALLIEVDLFTVQELRAVGPVAAWRRIQAKHSERATLACLYALQGALLGIPEKALPEAIKEELLNQIQSDW